MDYSRSLCEVEPCHGGWTVRERGKKHSQGPGAVTFDTSLVKDIPVRERMTLQFRAESFNVANHANLSVPVADLASPKFRADLIRGAGAPYAIRSEAPVLDAIVL